jgi:hypothetical protein
VLGAAYPGISGTELAADIAPNTNVSTNSANAKNRLAVERQRESIRAGAPSPNGNVTLVGYHVQLD